MSKIWIPPSEMWGDKKWVYDPEKGFFVDEEKMIASGREGVPYDKALDMLGQKVEPMAEEEPKTEETWQERRAKGVWQNGDPFPPPGHDMQGNWIGNDEWEKQWGPDGTEAKKYEEQK